MSESRDSTPPHRRRRFPRYAVKGTFPVRNLTTGTTMDLVDVSVGGFRSSSSEAFEPRARHTFEFPLGRPETVELTARAVYCYVEEGADDRHATGWMWTDVPVDQEGVPIGAAALIDYLTSGASKVHVTQLDADTGDQAD